MELVATLVGSVIGGGAAAGGAAAAAGGLFSLQGLGTVFSAVASIGAGIAANNEAKAEARQQEFAAKDEFIAGRETTAALKNELAKTIANNAVAFASGGADLSSVSVQTARQQATKDAEQQLAIATSEAGSRMLQRRRAAANARSRGRMAMFKGFVGAAEGLANAKIDQGQIG